MPTEISGSTGVNKIQSDAIEYGDLPTGSVVQVVRGEDEVALTMATATYTDSGLTATITPKSTNSKILAMWNMQAHIFGGGQGFGTKLVRGSTGVWTSNNQYGVHTGGSGGGDWRLFGTYSYIDSPNTTSATTYKIQVSSYSGNSMEFNDDTTQTQLILMEIAG
jgi:hypothetical protein